MSKRAIPWMYVFMVDDEVVEKEIPLVLALLQTSSIFKDIKYFKRIYVEQMV